MNRLGVAVRGWVVLAMVGLLPGCGVLSKRSECKTLVEDINRNGATFKPLEKSEDLRKVSASARALGAAALQLGSDVSGRTFTVSELKQFATDYANFSKQTGASMNDFAKTTDQLADLKDQVDDNKPTSSTKKFGAAAQKFGDHCKARPSGGCVGVAKVLQRLPSKGSDMDAYARGLDTAAADMKRVPADAGLKPVAEELVRQTEALAGVFRGLADATRKLKATQAELDTTLAREKPMNASIKAFCGAK